MPESQFVRHREIQLPAGEGGLREEDGVGRRLSFILLIPALPHLYCTLNEVHPLTAIEIYFQV